jgi:hypothetical protein
MASTINSLPLIKKIWSIEFPDDPRSPITLMSRTGIKQLLDLEKLLCLSINLNGPKPVLPKGRTLLRSWTVLITLDEKDNPVHYSELITWPKENIEVSPQKPLTLAEEYNILGDIFHS